MADAYQYDAVKLPPELRALVAFLDIDSRPSAVFPPLSRDNVHLQPLYRNPALLQLTEINQNAWHDLQDAIRETWHIYGNLKGWHGKPLHGRKWRAALCQEYLVVTAIDGTWSSQGTDKQSRQDSPEGESRPNGHPRNRSLSWSLDKTRSLDWTQHDIPNLPPWLRFVKDFDWASTSVGPVESWSVLLRQYVLMIMNNPNPKLIVWGDDMTFIYNEACVPLFGEKHPHCMGKHTSVPWAEAWSDIKPILDAAFAGETTQISHHHLAIERNGFLEETYWDFTLLPIYDPEGYAMGVFDEIAETTPVVTGERRRQSVNSLNSFISSASTLPELWSAALRSLEESTVDVPFAMLYAVEDDVPFDNCPAEPTPTEIWSAAQHAKCAKLVGTVGMQDSHPGAIQSFALLEHIETGVGISKPCLNVWKTREWEIVRSEDGSLPSALAFAVPGRSFGDTIQSALVCPIRATSGDDVLGVLVFGLNTRCPFEGEYEIWVHIMVDFIEKAAALISLPEEQRKAKKIADDINNALAQQLRLTTLKAERSEAKFTRLASSAPTGMFMFDVENRPIYVNNTYMKMLGVENDENYSNRPDSLAWKEQIHPEDLDRFEATWNRIADDKLPVTIEYRLKKPWSSDGMSGETWLLATAFPEIEADGSVTTVQGWLTDISHRKFSENLLSQRLEDALENKRQTENFIDMTSHEMRNPLSAILQSADSIVSTLTSAGMPTLDDSMMLSATTAADIVDAAQTIILCAQHQKRIVDDILTLSKLDASLLVISPDKVQAPTLITKALKMYEAEIERAGIDAQICIEPTYEELGVDWVLLDPSRLLQVIINLLTNSIKFTQHADVRKIKICIGASYQRPTGKHHGISFVPQRQSRTPRTPLPTENGSGDDIFLQFAVYDTGRGLTEEEMKMLFQRFQQASPKTYSQYGGSGLGLFISRELCELQGGQIGVASKEEHTVFTFYVKAKQWVPNEQERSPRPTLNRFTSASASPMAFSRRGSVVMKEVTNQLSVRKENGSTIEDFQPIMRKRSFTPKPTNRLVEEETDGSNGHEKKEMHVLICEDNIINQKVMSQQLRRAGCVVHVANHGVECLDFLETSSFCSAKTPLHIILLDLEMPVMGGLETIRHIRQRQQTGLIISHIPVIAVTANARSEQIGQAIDAGVDEVITKPFRILELVPQMETLVAAVAKQATATKTTINGT